MINVGDVIYYIDETHNEHKVSVLSITDICPFNGYCSTIKFDVLIGDPTVRGFVISNFEIQNKDIVAFHHGYCIFNEETFVNYMKTHEITEDWR